MENNNYGEVFTIGDVVCKEDNWCERCGELNPFTTVVMTDPQYCLDCCEDEWLNLSEDDFKLIYINQTELRLEFYKECVESLESQLKGLKE